ncbi:MAG: hypothetical protein NZ853_08845 [Leptospiraceae bacterium]|nr:hypothetical protein [Leptospiraceae bacterium]MDW7975536.1 hypothetical protein [Leptospiraceae bacterium]
MKLKILPVFGLVITSLFSLHSVDKESISKLDVSKKSLDECIEGIKSLNPQEQLVHLYTCAKNYTKDEKFQRALLDVISDSQNYQVSRNSLLLLANQKKDYINTRLLEISQKEYYKNQTSLQYMISMVVYSNSTTKTKNQEKDYYKQLQNSEDEFLKDLASQLQKSK